MVRSASTASSTRWVEMIAACVLIAWLLPSPLAATPLLQAATLSDLRVHGNQEISDEEVLALAGVSLGDQVGDDIAVPGRASTCRERPLRRS